MKAFILKFWPLLIILSVWVVFASPYFLKGRVPFPSTYQVNDFAPWDAYDGFHSPVKNGATPDVITQIYPWRHLVIDIWKTGQVPLWNPYSFAGTPLLANYQSAALSPFNLLFLILPFIDAWSILILLQPLLAGLFTYVYVRSIKVSQLGSLTASIAFMFCGFLTVWMVYGTLGYAILFLPLALFSLEKFRETRSSWFLILLTLTIPFSFFSGHFQISIYFLLFVFLYVLYISILTKDKVFFLESVFSVILGLLISAPQILPSMEFYTQSVRSGLFQKSEVIPWSYLPTFLVPDFFGNPVTRNDWFGHYAEWNAFIGMVPILLAIYALIRKRSAVVLFYLITSILTFCLAFQTPLLDLLINLRVPVLSTSAVSRIIVLFSFSVVILSAVGIDELIQDLSKRKFTYFFVWLGVCVLLVALVWVSALFKIVLPADKVAIAYSNLKLPTAIFLCMAGAVCIPLFYKNKRMIAVVSGVLLILIIADMLRFTTKWQPFDPKNLVYPNVPVVSELHKISGVDRGFGNYGAELSNYYKIPSGEGYDALYSKRYGEFISSFQNGKLQPLQRSVVEMSKNGEFTSVGSALLGIRYIIHKISDGHSVWAFPFWTYPDGQFKEVYNDGKYQIFENTKAIPRTFLASSYTVLTSPQEILYMMFDSKTDLHSSVVLEQNPGTFQIGSGNAHIVSYTPNAVKVTTSAQNPSVLVLTDSFYPGWNAFVDGKQTPILRADYAFRAVSVPAGQHTVVFSYQPTSFIYGIYIAIIGVIGMMGEGILFRKKENSKSQILNSK